MGLKARISQDNFSTVDNNSGGSFKQKGLSNSPLKAVPSHKRKGLIQAIKDATTSTVNFTGSYSSNFNSSYLDGIPDTPGGGSDLSPSQLYIGVPSFLAENPTLTTACGFQPWPWDPRIKAHEVPVEWPSAESTGNYFIDSTHVNATDTNNPYGYPDQPRATIPAWPSLQNLPAGTIMEFGGGTYAAADFRGAQGTAENPVFIRGSDGLAVTDMPQFQGNGSVLFEGASYVIFEQFKFVGGNTLNSVISTSFNGDFGDTSHVVIRGNYITDIDYINGGGGIVAISADDRNGGCKTENIVIYNNTIQGIGENPTWYSYDYDHHGVAFTTRTDGNEGVDGRTEVSKVWVLDNTITETSGNGVQIVSAGSPTKDHRDRVKYIWVAGNTTGFSRQAGLWAKRCSHVVFSQNTVTDCKMEYFAGNGQASGCQYGPTDVWYIANRYQDCHFGIQQTDTGSDATFGKLYCIANIMSGFRQTQDQSDAWRDGTAFSFTSHGNMDRYIVGNTVYNAVNGIAGSSSVGVMQSASNIFILRDGTIASPTTSTNEGNFYQSGTSGNNISATNDQCYRSDGSWAAYINGSSYSTTESVNALTGYSNLLDTDPLLTDPENDDFLPGVSSPALGSGTFVTPDGTNVRQVHLNQYGLDIGYGFLKTQRNLASPDRGAVEAV